ncbi:MAG: glutathione S-transferase family protein [Proteobacteria bacterium]|nr:glutathione S-transferase family protein [Pseudomonadota bacterium]
MNESARPHVVHFYDSRIPSGNAYKVHLLLRQLEAPAYATTELDLLASPSDTRRPAFLAKNPNGRIPTVELSDGSLLPESNAILYYLAEGTPMLPASPLERARALAWMFFEQYSHEPFVAVLKFWTYWGGLEHKAPQELERLRKQGQAALDVMEQHLDKHTFFVAEHYSVADISLFAYTQSAETIGYRVGPRVKAWLQRVAARPRYIPIKPDPLGKIPR